MCELNSSISCKLGQKEYWDQFYAKEFENFQDFGEVDTWFGQKNVDRIINWLKENKVDKLSSILDVGCGNGITLVSLAKAGFANLTGIDYAEEAINLAKCVAKENNVKVQLEAVDFLDASKCSETSILKRTFQVIIDKGTYDAVCLSPEDAQKKRGTYAKQIYNLLDPTGYFIIVSCNWTKEELVLLFNDFHLEADIKIPSISFGGKTGQTVTTLIMTRGKQITV